MTTHRAEHPGGRRERASRTAPGRKALQKTLQLWGNLKSIYRLNERKFGLWLKKEVPCIIMSFRATGRRLLVERTLSFLK